MPSIPAAGMWVMYMFNSISLGRRTGANGPEPFSFTDIKAWCDLSDTELDTWEFNALKELDITFLNTWYSLNTRKK